MTVNSPETGPAAPTFATATSGVPDARGWLEKVGDYAKNLVSFNDFAADWNTAYSGNDNMFAQLASFGLHGTQTAINASYTLPVKAFNQMGAAAQATAGIAGRALTAPISLSHPDWGKQLGVTDDQYHNMVLGSIFDLDAKVAPGQILAGEYSSPGHDNIQGGLWSSVKGQNINPYAVDQTSSDPNINPFGPNGSAHFSSGVADTFLSTTFDPTNLAGPGLKVVKGITVGEKALTNAPKVALGLTKVTGADFLKDLANPQKYGNMVQRFIAGDGATLLNDPYIRNPKNVQNPKLFAQLMGGATDSGLVADVFQVTGKMGTKEDILAAAERLKAANPESTELPYLLDRIQNGTLEKIAAARSGSNLILDPAIMHAQGGVIKTYIGDETTALGRAYKDAVDRITTFEDGSFNRVGVLKRTPWRDGALANSAATRAANKSASLYGDGADWEAPNITYHQPTSAHPMMAVVNWWTKGRPAGVIGAHDGDNFQEFASMLRHWDKYTNFAFRDSGESKAWMNTFLAAQNSHDVMTVSEAAELRAFQVMAGQHGLSMPDAERIYKQLSQTRRQGIESAKTNGFISTISQGGDPMIAAVPQLQRQAANEIHMAFDFRELNKVLKMHTPEAWQSILKASPEGALAVEGAKLDPATKFMDLTNNLFKMNALFRLGYTVRNLSEAYLSMAASGYLGTVAMTAGKGHARNWLANTNMWAQQKVDRGAIKTGLRDSQATLQHQLNDEYATYRQLDANHQVATDFLSGQKIPWDQMDMETRTHVARIRGEVDRDFTYHVTNTGLPSIQGDFLPTVRNRTYADDRLRDYYDYHSIGDFGKPGLPTVEHPSDLSGAGAAFKASLDRAATPSARAEAMLNHANDLLADGKVLDYTTRLGGWAPMTEKSLAQFTESRTRDGVFKLKPGEHKIVLRSRDADKRPQVVSVPSYGKHVDFSDGRKVPAGVDLNDRAALAQWARDNGVGRVTVKDPEWGKTTLVLRDTAAYKGGMGVKPIVKRNLDALATEGEANGHIVVLPSKGRTGRQRATAVLSPDMEATASRAVRSTTNDATNRVPVSSGRGFTPIIPGWQASDVRAKVDAGLLDTIRAIGEGKARSQAKIDKLEKVYAARNVRTDKVYGSKRIGHSGPDEAFDKNDPQGNYMASATSSATTQEKLIGNGDLTSVGPTALNRMDIDPSDPRYFQGWANMVNHYITGEDGKVDPLYKAFMDGRSDVDIEEWLNGKGRRYADEVGWHGDLEHHVAGARASYNMYVTPDVKAKIANGEKVTESELRSTHGKRQDLPTLFAALVPGSPEQRADLLAGHWNERATRKMFTMLGTMPETALARHPLFVAAYGRERTRMLKELRDAGVKDISTNEYNHINFVAREFGRQEVGRVLYTINRRTDAARQLRFISPFYAAWENAIQRWSGFAYHNADSMSQLASKMAFVTNNATILDTNGDPVSFQDAISDYNKFKDAQILLPGGDKNKPQESTRISLQGLDVVLGGQPGPGIGPLAQVPLYPIVKNQPALADMLSWAFPTGVPKSVADMFLNAYERRLKSMVTKDETYTNDYNKLYASEMIEWKLGNRPQYDAKGGPALDEISDMTNKLYAIRFFAGVASPASPQIGTTADFYINQFRTIQDLHRGEPNGSRVATDEFLQKFPEAFIVIPGLSKNNYGLLPTVASVDNAKRYNNLAVLAQSSEIADAGLFSFVGNYGQTYGKGDFSAGAYSWQQTNDPGFGDAYRTKASAPDMLHDANVAKGWVEFGKAMDASESQLMQQGYKPTDKYFVQIMRTIRQNFDLDMQKSNADWHHDYRDASPVRFDQRADFFRHVVSDPNFKADHGSDPFVGYIGTFLGFRDQVAGMLRDRKAQGGSQSLSANKNQDIQDAYDQSVNDIKAKNIQFASWYDRYFTNDPVVY